MRACSSKQALLLLLKMYDNEKNNLIRMASARNGECSISMPVSFETCIKSGWVQCFFEVLECIIEPSAEKFLQHGELDI